MNTYQEAVEYILQIPRFAGKTGTDNLKCILSILGNPEKSVPAVHVAGTNGKGSVCKMLSLIFNEAGKKTGLFISPHLEKINERISVNGEDISDEDFLYTFQIVEEAVKKNQKSGNPHPSFFEFLFIMAAVYFKNKGCEETIYETGLGGRLDATNVLAPQVSVITSIGMDHMQYLGDTIEKIAYEKAGIIKSGVPVVYNSGNPLSDEVIKKQALKLGSISFDAGTINKKILKETLHKIDFSMTSRYYDFERLTIYSAARYQLDNVATAIVAAETIYPDETGFKDWIYKALKNFEWSGRMEWIKSNVLIDGAHNENAAKKLTDSLNYVLENGRWNHTELLFAASSDKDYKTVTKILSDKIKPEKIYVTEFNSDRSTDGALLEHLFRDENSQAEIYTYKSVEDAVNAALKYIDDDTFLLITGSLYLVGEVKAFLKSMDS